MAKKIILPLAVLIALCAAALLLAMPAQKGGEGADCRAHGDCASKVCNFIKQDMGKCEAARCILGLQTVGIDGKVEYLCKCVRASETPSQYVCEQSGWVKVADGEQTCKDNPYCDLSKPCEAGLKRVLREDQYDSTCRESMAQMVLPTVCVPCGNNVCDGNESKCNCPEDCGCIGEGNTTTYAPAGVGCCSGLQEADLYTFEFNGMCNLLNTTGGVCINCGNGACGPGENKCNCPGDCATSSGIAGIIMLGPTCPVQRIGESCERPYAATVVVKSAGSEITRFTSGDDGRFTVALPPGTYDLEPLAEGGAMLPRGEPQTVVVQAGQLTNVTINYDTGIR